MQQDLSKSDRSPDELEQICYETSLLTKCGEFSNQAFQAAGGVRKSERIRKSRATRLKTVAQKASNQNAQTTYIL